MFQENEADAISLDGGHIFEAHLAPYNLKPVVAEVYGTGKGTFAWRTLIDHKVVEL